MSESEKAWREFILVLAESLKLDKFLEWLNNKLK